MGLYNMTAAQCMRMIKKRELSARELTDVYLKRIEIKDKDIKAYITVCADEAIKQAETVDKMLSRGENVVFAGVPVSVKDNICTDGIRTTCASYMLKNYVSTYNAHIADKLTAAGAIILGKTNLDEFAMGSFGNNSAFFQTQNPIDSEYVPGGSSSGTAASVAGGLAAVAVGSDTGGSVRVPASFCGAVGFKPTYGAISRFGLIAYASSLDTVGTVAKNVEDTILLSSVLYGRDARDMTSCDIELLFDEQVDLKKLRFAFSDTDLIGAEKEIQDTVLRVAELLERGGAARVDAGLFDDSKMEYAYKILACAEATSNLARYDGIKYGGVQGEDPEGVRNAMFGAEVKRRIDYGNFVLSKDKFDIFYKSAVQERARITEKTDRLFERADIILSPLCDFSVPKYSECDACHADRFTVVANFAGIPAISIPAGRDKNNMPISVQLMSKKYSDAYLLKVAQILEGLLREEAKL